METIENSPITIVIFGASGDLTHRKLIPALFNLFRKKRLPDSFNILGFSNLDWSDEVFRKSLQEGVKKFAEYKSTAAEWKAFAAHLHYMLGDFTKPEEFARLKGLLKKMEDAPAGRLYYLATPPQFFTNITENLGRAGMLDQKDGWRRVVIEKPFGSDLASARALNATLHKVMEESQIFRIDHYLGKETVQNLLIFRFANTIFEPIWNHEYIDHVQISVAEEVGVGHRAGYYEHAGVVRDMFQNHIMQLLTLIAMEPPDTFKHHDLHARKLQVIKALHPMDVETVKKNTVRGQYKGYHDEPGVAPDSQIETFAAMRVFVDTPRWKDVPFYLRSGKNMAVKCTEIIIQFDCPRYAVFPMPPANKITPNILAICIQPDEGIFLRFEAKVPDTEADMKSVEMEFHYSTSFGASSIPEAYERLILEVIQGDHTLFIQDDTTELAWKWIDPILAAWRGADAPALESYAPGSWGPDGADRLMTENDCAWQITCVEHAKNDYGPAPEEKALT